MQVSESYFSVLRFLNLKSFQLIYKDIYNICVGNEFF